MICISSLYNSDFNGNILSVQNTDNYQFSIRSNDSRLTRSIKQDHNDLVHVVPRFDCLVLFPQLDGPLGIAFQGEAACFFGQVKQGKHLPGHFENQGRVVKWKALSDARFGKAGFADLFDVHFF
jgi:hypothetical protein